MPWKSWNKADKTLLLAAVIFAFSICVHHEYPGSLFAQGFMFCAEAALVGGVADWFAVTALFRKPLGFPYHTAILPRRRESFINASTAMVQKEFFSRRKIFDMLHHAKLQDVMMEWINRDDIQKAIADTVIGYSRSLAAGIDTKKQAAELGRRIREEFSNVPSEAILWRVENWLREGENDHKLLAGIAIYLSNRVASPEFKDGVESMLESYQREKADSRLGLLLLGLAQATDVLNFEEIAGLIQKQLLTMLEELGEKDSELQTQLLEVFYEKGHEMVAVPEIRDRIEEVRRGIIGELPLEESIEHGISTVIERFSSEDKDPDSVSLRDGIATLISHEIQRWIKLLSTDQLLKKELDKLLYDISARSALAVQTMLGSVVHGVLDRMTDDELNHLVYDKAEPDLLWIRMNGSIVGSGIGLAIFVLIHIPF